MKSAAFATFEVKHAANGFEPGWYFRLTDSLFSSAPVGPYLTQDEAEKTARFYLPYLLPMQSAANIYKWGVYQ